MSLETLPAGGIRKYPAPEPTSETTLHKGRRVSVHYNVLRPSRSLSMTIPKSPPEHLLLNIEAAIENGAVFMRAIEVDIAVEGESPEDTLQSLIRTITGWLEYLREEQPALAPDLESQRRYVELLRYHPVTWFKPTRIG